MAKKIKPFYGKRTNGFFIRLSPRELEKLKARATLRQMSISDLLRESFEVIEIE